MHVKHWSRLSRVVLAGAIIAAPAQAQQLPAAKELVAKFVQATGGEAVIRKHQQLHMIGEFSVPAQNLTGNIELWSMVPGRLLTIVDIPGIGQMKSGYDGTTAWQINPMVGAQVVTGKQLDNFREQSDPHSLLNPDKYVKARETVEKMQFDSKDAYKVKVTATNGDEYFEFYDANTGLMIGVIRKIENQMGEIETTNYIGGYKEFDGQLVPTLTRQSLMGMEQILSVKTIEFKVADTTLFELPKEIKALTAK